VDLPVFLFIRFYFGVFFFLFCFFVWFFLCFISSFFSLFFSFFFVLWPRSRRPWQRAAVAECPTTKSSCMSARWMDTRPAFISIRLARVSLPKGLCVLRTPGSPHKPFPHNQAKDRYLHMDSILDYQDRDYVGSSAEFRNNRDSHNSQARGIRSQYIAAHPKTYHELACKRSLRIAATSFAVHSYDSRVTSCLARLSATGNVLPDTQSWKQLMESGYAAVMPARSERFLSNDCLFHIVHRDGNAEPHRRKIRDLGLDFHSLAERQSTAHILPPECAFPKSLRSN